MPELPDLEVFSHNLNKALRGKKLEKILVGRAKKLNVPAEKLQETLEGTLLKTVIRTGKELHMEFNNGHVLGLHLMLHGKLSLIKEGSEQKYLVLALKFAGGTSLVLSDFQAAATPTLDPAKSAVPDALEVSADYLHDKLSKTRTPVKTALMDQKILRGIGNTYADEILWDARLSPFSVSNKIPADNLKKLTRSIKKILKEAEEKILKEHPDTISGEYRDFMEVHLAGKEKTSTGSVIHQKSLASRKTYYTDEQELFR